jgi:phosphoribosyl-dephospho-CoA transferase
MRRSLCDDAKGLVPVGLPLPPRAGKKRLAFAVPPGEVVRTASPPLLADVAGSAPKAWQPCIDRLLHLDSGVRVYGSLAWQHLTGLAYLTDRSDLDLLWRRQDEESTRTLLAGLWAIDCGAPMHIDGEIVAADGMAVNWRELQSGAAEVIGRRLDALALVRSQGFIAGADDT